MNWDEFGIDIKTIESLDTDLLTEIIHKLIEIRNNKFKEMLLNFRIGEKVQWFSKRKRKIIQGIIINVGKVNLKIIAEGNTKWAVLPSFVKKFD